CLQWYRRKLRRRLRRNSTIQTGTARGPITSSVYRTELRLREALNPMDIQHLVDRLEDLIDEGRHIPMTKTTMIDEERALEIIDQMRISVPEEVDKASRIINQRDRLLAQANEEAARIVDLAKDKSETLIQRDAVVQAAQNRAANIIEQSRQDAEA